MQVNEYHSRALKIQSLWRGYTCRKALKSITKQYEDILKEVEGHISMVQWTSRNCCCIPKLQVINASLDEDMLLKKETITPKKPHVHSAQSSSSLVSINDLTSNTMFIQPEQDIQGELEISHSATEGESINSIDKSEISQFLEMKEDILEGTHEEVIISGGEVVEMSSKTKSESLNVSSEIIDLESERIMIELELVTAKEALKKRKEMIKNSLSRKY